RTRAREVYGFVVYVGTLLLFALYLAWALTPDDCLASVGIAWYPNRRACPSRSAHTLEWAILVPAWSILVVLITYLTYLALALSATPAFTHMTTLTGTFPSLAFLP
ncbi:hypothetical protein CALCODRAFT_422638, partial [Calocera cornea HHB12733]